MWAPAPDRPEDKLVPATRYAIGDTLIDLGDGLEIPAGWLPEGVTVEQVAAGSRPLLDKPAELVLPMHGEPADRAALERALA